MQTGAGKVREGGGASRPQQGDEGNSEPSGKLRSRVMGNSEPSELSDLSPRALFAVVSLPRPLARVGCQGRTLLQVEKLQK